MAHESNLMLKEVLELDSAHVDMDFPIPLETDFIDEEGDEVLFLDAPVLENIISSHLNTYEEFAELANVKIKCMWKHKGGVRGGKAVLGACRRATGLLKHFGRVDFIIWLAADRLRETAQKRDIEACLYHELRHIEYDPQDGKFGLNGHDFEGFASELRRFGVWRTDLEVASKAFRQLNLFEAEK
jgi:hypothetical protein